jgi:hypothetical protein
MRRAECRALRWRRAPDACVPHGRAFAKRARWRVLAALCVRGRARGSLKNPANPARRPVSGEGGAGPSRPAGAARAAWGRTIQWTQSCAPQFYVDFLHDDVEGGERPRQAVKKAAQVQDDGADRS